jgi:hypothetical protein
MLTRGALAAVFSCHKRDEERRQVTSSLLNDACEGKGEADCQRPTCVWCKSSAVPSACYTPVGASGRCIDMHLQLRAFILAVRRKFGSPQVDLTLHMPAAPGSTAPCIYHTC